MGGDEGEKDSDCEDAHPEGAPRPPPAVERPCEGDIIHRGEGKPQGGLAEDPSPQVKRVVSGENNKKG
jgi:hypothetical protein